MFTDLIGRVDDHGIGPILQLLAITYLCYLAVYKNIKVPSIIFLLYGFGSLLFIFRYNNLLKADSQLNHNQKTSSISYEKINIYLSFILCMVTAFMVW